VDVEDIATVVLTAAGGITGIAAISFLVTQFVGKSWIESKFQRSLEGFKHQHEIEIQHLRIKVNTLLSGNLKLQEKEFEALTKTWALINDAYSHVSSFVHPLQTLPDLNRHPPERVEEFLNSSRLTESQKNDVRDSGDKTKAFENFAFYYRLSDLETSISKLAKHNVKYAIFFPEEIRGRLEKIARLLNEVKAAKEIGTQHKDFKMQTKSWDDFKNNAQPLYDELENLIRSRLRSHGLAFSESKAKSE
jgi:hypothetical protein